MFFANACWPIPLRTRLKWAPPQHLSVSPTRNWVNMPIWPLFGAWHHATRLVLILEFTMIPASGLPLLADDSLRLENLDQSWTAPAIVEASWLCSWHYDGAVARSNAHQLTRGRQVDIVCLFFYLNG